MKITDVRMRKISREGKMKAIVSVTFDDEFVVHDIKIIDGENGLFVAMPSRQIASGDFRDIAHPINSETREKIQNAIFVEYERVLELEEKKTIEPGETLENMEDLKTDEKSEDLDSDKKEIVEII